MIQTKSLLTAKEKLENTLVLHCKHEKRLDGLTCDMHHIYDLIFNGSSAMDVEITAIQRANYPDKVHIDHY
jgi:hypothetical protein